MAGLWDSIGSFFRGGIQGPDAPINLGAVETVLPYGTGPMTEIDPSVITQNDFANVDSGLFQPQNMSVATPEVAQSQLFNIQTPQNMSVDPTLVAGNPNLNVNYGGGAQSLVGGGVYEPQVNVGNTSYAYGQNIPGAPAAAQAQGEAGLLDSLYGGVKNAVGSAGLKDWGPLMQGAGGLYQAIQAQKLNDEYMKTLKQNRQLAKDEQQRQKDFTSSWSSTPSNYYSA